MDTLTHVLLFVLLFFSAVGAAYSAVPPLVTKGQNGTRVAMTAAVETVVGRLFQSALATLSSPAVGGQGAGPLVWLPRWRQYGGYLPDGSPDPQQYNDCGETCVAGVLAAKSGVCVHPGDVRQALGGVTRSGLTTSADLANACHIYHVEAQALDVPTTGLIAFLQRSWGARQPVIVLGRYGPMQALHHVTCVQADNREVKVIDPWIGALVSWSSAGFCAAYASSLVVIMSPLAYDMSAVAEPGT